MHVPSSMTVMPPEPSIEPACATDSKSSLTSRCSGMRKAADAPPGMKALSGLSPRMPPAMS